MNSHETATRTKQITERVCYLILCYFVNKQKKNQTNREQLLYYLRKIDAWDLESGAYKLDGDSDPFE